MLTFVIISCFSRLEIRYGICVNLTLQNVLLVGLEKMHVKSHELRDRSLFIPQGGTEEKLGG